MRLPQYTVNLKESIDDLSPYWFRSKIQAKVETKILNISMLHTIDPQNLSIWHVHCNGTRLEEFRPLPSSDSEKCHFRHISSYIQPMFINPTAMHQVLQIPVTIDAMVRKILQIQITAWMASYLAAMCLCVCVRSRISPSAHLAPHLH